MKHELRRVDPLRTANIGALVYGLMLAVFALFFSPFFLMAGLFMPSEGPAGGTFFLGFMLLLYPFFGAVMGWISGLLTSVIYNVIVRWTGGLLLEFDGSAPTPASGSPGT